MRARSRSESAAAALSALLHFLGRPSVDQLRQVLGLTSSGTVRLLDRLAESGYVRREPGADGGSTSIGLTDAGRQAAVRVSRARAAVVEDALAVLSPAERANVRAPGQPGHDARTRRDAVNLPALRCWCLPRRRGRLPGRERRARALRGLMHGPGRACRAAMTGRPGASRRRFDGLLPAGLRSGIVGM